MMRWLVLLSVLVTLAVNGLANSLPINGQTTGEISDRFDVLFTPAGYVFAIWGLIYLGQIALAVYQALPAQADHPRLNRARPWLAASGAANVAWILLWHYEQFPLTLVAMLTLLTTLIVAYLRLGIGHTAVGRPERWFVQVPQGIYLGWISVATIANASVVLVVLGWQGGGIDPQTWTLALIGVALALGVILARARGEVAFPLVLAWAFAGIAVRQAGFPGLALGAWLAAGLAVATAVLGLAGRRRLRPTGA